MGEEEYKEDDSKWRCCCGCCHVVTGAKVIGLFHFFSALLSIIFTILNMAIILMSDDKKGLPTSFSTTDVKDQQDTAVVVGGILSIIVYVIVLIVSGLLLYGLYRDKMNRSKWMVPYLVAAAIWTILTIFTIIFFILFAWLWYVVYCAYRYIKVNAERDAAYRHQMEQFQDQNRLLYKNQPVA